MVRSCSWDRVGWHSQIFIDLEIGSESQSVHILVPLEGGITLKNVVILCVVSGLVGG